MGSLWQQFKTFAFKGNMIDLAVAVVIGTAFGNVVKSLVDNVIMPITAYAQASTSQPAMDYTTWHLGNIKIGTFLGSLVNFLIVAVVVFAIIVKILGSIMKAANPPRRASRRPRSARCACPLSRSKPNAAHCTADLPA